MLNSFATATAESPADLDLGSVGLNDNNPAEADSELVIARQAIVDEHRAVFGYELFDRSIAADAHSAASDAAMLFNALSYAGAEALEFAAVLQL